MHSTMLFVVVKKRIAGVDTRHWKSLLLLLWCGQSEPPSPAHLIENPRVQIFDEPAYTHLAIYNTQCWELQLNLLNSTDKEKNNAFQIFWPNPNRPDPRVDPTRVHPWLQHSASVSTACSVINGWTYPRRRVADSSLMYTATQWVWAQCWPIYLRVVGK